MKRKTQDPRIAQKVIEMVAVHYKTTPEVIKGKEGDRLHRQVVMHVLKDALGSSLKGTCEALSTTSMTVYTASKTVKELLKTDTALATLIEEIKTEVLMLSAIPGGGQVGLPTTSPSSPLRQTISAGGKPNPPEPIETASVVTTMNTTQVIGKVQKAVTSFFLGADLLQSRDPAAEVLLAKDAVVFLVWDDFPKITLPEILSAFHLDQDGLYRAIGRISVCLKEDGGELKKKLKAARAACSPA